MAEVILKARQELKERALENEKSVRTALGLEELAEGESSDDEEEDDGGEFGGKFSAVGIMADTNSAQPRAGPSTHEFSDDEQMATVTIEEDYVPTIPTVSRYTDDADGDGDEDRNMAGPSSERERESKAKRAVPLMPASSKRAKDKAKSKAKKEDEKRSRSMETKAERKKGRALELTRRVGKAGRAMDRDGKKRGLKGKGAAGKGKGKRPTKKR